MPRTKKSKFVPGAWRKAPIQRLSEDQVLRARNRRSYAKHARAVREYYANKRLQETTQVRQQETAREEPNISVESGPDHDDGGYSYTVGKVFSHRHTYQDRKSDAADAWERDKFYFKDLYQKSISQGLPRSETTSFGEVTCPSNSCTEMRKTKMNLFFMFAHKKQIVRSCRCRPLIKTLIENHFIPATYQSPRSSVHLGALEMFSQMQKNYRTTAAAWAKSLNDRNEKDINKGPRLGTRVLNKTYLAYTRIKLLVEEELQTKASVDTSPAVLPAP